MTNFISARTLTVSTLTFAAAALSGCSMQGYGHNTAFAGANCNDAIAAACGGRYGQYAQGTAHHGEKSSALRGLKSGKTRYGTAYQTAGYTQQTYMQQAPMMPFAYQQPTYQTPAAPSYNVELFEPAMSTTTSYGPPANCPAGTTAQSDGTCLQGSSYNSASYTSSYTTPSYSGGYMSTSAATESCPAGTTSSSDGTCLMGGSTSYTSSYSTPSYGSSSASRGVAPAISTHDFSDYAWGSKDTTWGSDSYVSPGTRTVDAPYSYPTTSVESGGYSASNYLPIRK